MFINPSAILVVNLGTPEAPTAAAVRKYLAEFLSDRSVVDLPALLWQPLLRGIILPLRSPRSAEKYAEIWQAPAGKNEPQAISAGAPLRYHTERLTIALQQELAGGDHLAEQLPIVVYAMRYGTPAIATVLDSLCAQGVLTITVVALYPQYATSSTGSVVTNVQQWQEKRLRQGSQPQIRLKIVAPFFDDAGYIAALATSVRQHWEMYGRADQLLMSFHGIPQRAADSGDPYEQQCLRSAHLLAQELGLSGTEWKYAFQSRFGYGKWLQPATLDVLNKYARAHNGAPAIDVICPGFLCDCLETLHEIGIEYREAYIAAGGKKLTLIPCLNDRPYWVKALAQLIPQYARDIS